MNALPPRLSSFRIVQPRLQLPVMRGVIERRLLVNYRCSPDIVAKLLPAPFRPKLIHGHAMAGICLIRLGELRPGFVPASLGLTSENAAHRIAVEWEDQREMCSGVFIPRRDSNSQINRFAGGGLFPAIAQAAKFQVAESEHRLKIELRSIDGATFVRVAARLGEVVPTASLFGTLEEASDFFRAGCIGWSTRAKPEEFDGVELCCDQWDLKPLIIERVESSFFNNPLRFPRGTAMFDSAFLMRGITHEWHARGRMVCEKGAES